MQVFFLWYTENRERLFLLPEGQPRPAGTLRIWRLTGGEEAVAPEWAAAYEVSDEQARRWARHELGDTLDELKRGIDARIAEARANLQQMAARPVTPDPQGITPDAGPALFEFLKALPGVIGKSLSGDEQRLDSARQTLEMLQQRLRDAGIDVDDRMKSFADRLASIRTDAESKKAPDDKP